MYLLQHDEAFQSTVIMESCLCSRSSSAEKTRKAVNGKKEGKMDRLSHDWNPVSRVKNRPTIRQYVKNMRKRHTTSTMECSISISRLKEKCKKGVMFIDVVVVEIRRLLKTLPYSIHD
jgi:hypothetical protein